MTSVARISTHGLLVCLSAVCMMVSAAAARAVDTTTLLVPALRAERPSLGFGVSAIIGLQVWQTLRKSAPEAPGKIFGNGLIIWDPEALEVQSHETAAKSARRGNVLSQAVLWGAAYEYGDAVVAQFNLSLPDYNDFRSNRPEVWQIRMPGGEQAPSIAADLPSRRYAFEPVVLDKEIVAAFSNPAGLPLYSAPTGAAAVGRLGGAFTALESRPDTVFVQAGQTQGWVRLVQISRSRSEVADFVSAMIRIYREDWDGARDFLGRVTENPATPAMLRTDAYLLRAMAGARAGRGSEQTSSDLDAAGKLSPNARRVVVYRAMAAISYATALEPCRRVAAAKAIAADLEEKRYVFPPGDPWLEQWPAFEKALGSGCG